MPDEAEAAQPEKKPAKAVVPSAGGGRAVAATAGGPAVVVVPLPETGLHPPRVSRRKVLLVGFWAGMGALMLSIVATILNSLYPRGITGFGGSVYVGTVDQLLPGVPLHNLEAKTWLVKFDAEQARRNGGQEGAILALYQRCVHLGCTVPWRSDFSFEDPRSGETYAGWFRCPCHGSTYTAAGVKVFGPAPHALDTFGLTIKDGKMTVDTGKKTTGDNDTNASRAVLPS